MAKTIINLSDPVSTLVTKTNTISSHLGDLSQLNVGSSNDSDLVQAINFVNVAAQKTDSADIIALIDSSYVQAREGAASAGTIRAFFQKDSANAIGYDSSAGRFFVPSNTINSAMIENAAIISGKLATNSVGTDAIVDGNVTGPKIASNAVGTIKINALAVTTAKIAATAVTAAKLATDAVTTTKIEDDAVTGAKIAADAIDGTKIADDAINSEHYTDQSIDTAHIADGQVTGAKIANDTVAEANMADDAIGSAQLKTLSTLLIKNSSGSTLKTIHGAGA